MTVGWPESSQTALNPDSRICTLRNFLHLDYFLPSRQLCAATAALLPFPGFIYLDYFTVVNKNCAAIAPCLHKIFTMTAKTRAIPSLHRVSFAAKVSRSCPDTASGNTTSPYCRAASGNNSSRTSYLNRRIRIVSEMQKKHSPSRAQEFCSPSYNHLFAAKHMLLCPPGLLQSDKI